MAEKRSNVPKNGKITLFFPSKKKIDKLPSSSESFYEEKLLQESDNLDLDTNSQLNVAHEEIRILKETVEQQKKDIKALKYLLNASNRLCVAKDLKIEILERNSTVQCDPEVNLFKKFEGKMDQTLLKQLRAVREGQQSDSTFVLNMIRHFYANNTKALLNKTAVGSIKDAITPDKKATITVLLKERVLREEQDGNRVNLRLNRINNLINDAISNITRPLKRVIFVFPVQIFKFNGFFFIDLFRNTRIKASLMTDHHL